MWFLRTFYQRESLGKIWGIRQMGRWRSILYPNRQPLLRCFLNLYKKNCFLWSCVMLNFALMNELLRHVNENDHVQVIFYRVVSGTFSWRAFYTSFVNGYILNNRVKIGVSKIISFSIHSFYFIRTIFIRTSRLRFAPKIKKMYGLK